MAFPFLLGVLHGDLGRDVRDNVEEVGSDSRVDVYECWRRRLRTMCQAEDEVGCILFRGIAMVAGYRAPSRDIRGREDLPLEEGMRKTPLYLSLPV